MLHAARGLQCCARGPSRRVRLWPSATEMASRSQGGFERTEIERPVAGRADACESRTKVDTRTTSNSIQSIYYTSCYIRYTPSHSLLFPILYPLLFPSLFFPSCFLIVPSRSEAVLDCGPIRPRQHHRRRHPAVAHELIEVRHRRLRSRGEVLPLRRLRMQERRSRHTWVEGRQRPDARAIL